MRRELLFLLFLSLFSVNVFAWHSGYFVHNGIKYSMSLDGTATVVDCTNANLHVPATADFEWEEGTGDDKRTYSETYTVTAVNIGGNGAIESVSAPFVNSIQLRHCANLKTVSAPNVYKLGDGAFGGCNALLNVNTPNVTTLGASCFSGCSALNDISFINVTNIGASCFENCSSLTDVNYTNVSKIEASVFQGCSSLKEINLPNVDVIGESSFNGCSALTRIYLPKLKTAQGNSFRGCTALKEVDLPCLESVGSACFNGCSSLKKLRLPALTVIDENAFEYSQIEEIDLPTVTNLTAHAFACCFSLKKVTCINAEIVDTRVFNGRLNRTFAPVEELNLPKVKIVERLFGSSYASPHPIKRINIQSADSVCPNAFEDYRNLQEIVINSKCNIGRYAFNCCYSLKSINLPNVEKLEDHTFANCDSLKDVTMPKLKVIGPRAFYSCDSLENIDMPKVEIVGEEAFERCMWNLKEINLPSAKKIDKGAFVLCRALSRIILPEVEEVGEAAFSSSDRISELILPKVKTIGDGAFDGASLTFKSLSFPLLERLGNGVFGTFAGDECPIEYFNAPKLKYIGSSAFERCWSLREVDIPLVEEIGEKAFEECGLEGELKLPQLKTIGENAFYKCTKLRNFQAEKAESIGENAFEGCEELRDVDVREVKSLGEWAFSSTKIEALDLPNLEVIPKKVDNTYVTKLNISSAKILEPYAISGSRSMKELYLPNCIEKIGIYALGEIYSNLEYIELEASTPPECDKQYDNIYRAKLVVPAESVEAYKAHPIWGKFNIQEQMERKLYKSATFGYGEYMEEVKGVTADGASQIAVFPAVEPEDETTMVELSVDNKSVPTSISGEISALQEFPDGRWGYIYTAPIEFMPDCDKESYTVSLKINSAPAAQTTIEVYRPGVLLVHGLRSEGAAWKDMEKYLNNSGAYKNCQVLCADYKSTHEESFEDNTHKHKVVERHINQLEYNLLSNKIVSAKYDLVGHSMGGILNRLYAQEVNKEQVHKIITVNTPHLGSLGASLLKKGKMIISEIIGQVHDNEIDTSPAVSDLMPASGAMRKLARHANEMTGIPCHALCSYMTPPVKISEEKVCLPISSGIGIPNIGCVTIDVPKEEEAWSIKEYFDDILGEDKNDGVVTLTSQKGNMNDAHTTVLKADFGRMGYNSPAFHTNVCHWEDAQTKIFELLKEDVNSSKFSTSAFTSSLRSYAAKNTASNEESVEIVKGVNGKDGTLHISAVEKSDSLGKAYVNVGVEMSENMVMSTAFTFLDKENMIMGMNLNEYNFMVPETYSGNLKLYALGRTSEGKLISDSCEIVIENESELIFIRFSDREDILMVEGQRINQSITGLWSNMAEKEIEGEYEAENPDVIAVEGSEIHALKSGKSKLYAHFENMTDSINVKVIPAKLSGIDEVKELPEFEISTDHNSLRISLGRDIDDGVEVSLWNMDGARIIYDKKLEPIMAGETLVYSLPAAHRQVYILRVAMKNGTYGYKLVH
jgi:surface antigen bspA-like